MGIETGDYQTVLARVHQVRAGLVSLRVAVRSPDRSVTATVDAGGELRDLRIEPALAQRLTVASLARNILGAARLGAAQAREHVRVAVRDALPDRLRHLVAPDGTVDLAALLDGLGDAAQARARTARNTSVS